MPAADFLDTNVLVYAYDPTDKRKQKIARQLIRESLSGGAVTSTQVLGEFVATLLHKLAQAPSSEEVTAVLDALSPIDLIQPDSGTVRRAVEAHAAYGLHFYDGMIVAAAERAGCTRILSEDFNAGQRYFGIVADNPFA